MPISQMGKLGYRNTKKLTQTAEMESGGAGCTRQGAWLSVPCRAALQCQEVPLSFLERITDLLSWSEGWTPHLTEGRRVFESPDVTSRA